MVTKRPPGQLDRYVVPRFYVGPRKYDKLPRVANHESLIPSIERRVTAPRLQWDVRLRSFRTHNRLTLQRTRFL